MVLPEPDGPMIATKRPAGILIGDVIERADLELIALVDSAHMFEFDCVLFVHEVMPFEPDAGSLCTSGGVDWVEPRSHAPFYLYFTIQLRAKPCQRVGLGVGNRAPEFDPWISIKPDGRSGRTPWQRSD